MIDSAGTSILFGPKGPILPVSEEQVFDQCNGGENQDDDHKKQEEAHSQHHLAHVPHHRRPSLIRPGYVPAASQPLGAPGSARAATALPRRRSPGSQSASGSLTTPCRRPSAPRYGA